MLLFRIPTRTHVSLHTHSILCSEIGTAILRRLIEIVIDILVIIVVVVVVVVVVEVATSMDHPTVVVGGEEVVHHPWIITEVSEIMFSSGAPSLLQLQSNDVAGV